MRTYRCFFINDTAPPEIYTLSLHDALPIYQRARVGPGLRSEIAHVGDLDPGFLGDFAAHRSRSEEHTSELQSRRDLVCRLLLEKKKNSISILLSSETDYYQV